MEVQHLQYSLLTTQHRTSSVLQCAHERGRGCGLTSGCTTFCLVVAARILRLGLASAAEPPAAVTLIRREGAVSFLQLAPDPGVPIWVSWKHPVSVIKISYEVTAV
jgi:hypothetical protein